MSAVDPGNRRALAEQRARERFVDAVYDLHENRNHATVARYLAASQELEDARRGPPPRSRARKRKAA